MPKSAKQFSDDINAPDYRKSITLMIWIDPIQNHRDLVDGDRPRARKRHGIDAPDPDLRTAGDELGCARAADATRPGHDRTAERRCLLKTPSQFVGMNVRRTNCPQRAGPRRFLGLSAGIIDPGRACCLRPRRGNGMLLCWQGLGLRSWNGDRHGKLSAHHVAKHNTRKGRFVPAFRW